MRGCVAVVALATLLLPRAAISQPSAAAPAPARTRTLLDGSSFWRFHLTLRRPLVPVAALRAAGREATAPLAIPTKVAYRNYPGSEKLETAPPPANWMNADFDDARWPRARAVAAQGSVAQAIAPPGLQFSAGLLCLRGKFAVTDPAAVRELCLTLSYRGGVVVHLNGREVARRDLPAGPLSPATPGDPYPPEAYVDAKGALLPDGSRLAQRVAAGENDLTERVAKRNRMLERVALPRAALRAGVNILAIEVHRSDYLPAALQSDPDRAPAWVPLAVQDVNLAVVGDGATPNLARPTGFQVWAADINDRVTPGDYGDPNEPLAPILLQGARNGIFAGQLAIGATAPLRGLKAVSGELRAAAGGASLPAQSVRFAWGRLDGSDRNAGKWFDGLTEEPPANVPLSGNGAVQSLRVAVRVPRDAAAGDYRGAVRLAAEGMPEVTVPIVLRVADWTIPDPSAFRTYVGLMQSPATLALQYGVPEWSEEHWRFMERSFALLARAGNKLVIVPVVDRTQFGNENGMITWINRGDGRYDYDFTVLDRFLDLAGRHQGAPDVVALQVWHSGGWEARKADQENTVTVRDARSGALSHMQVPVFGTAESKAFWKPLLDAVRARLALRKWDEAMCLGILSDGTAPPEVFRAFDEIVPGGAGWMRACHSVTRAQEPYMATRGAGRVVLHEYCYGMAIADPDNGLPPIWKQRRWPGTAFIRHNFDDTLSLLKYRTLAERALYCGTRGIGRTGLDFWVVPAAGGRDIRVFNRYPMSSCGQREPNMWRLAWPGERGAEPTVRFENMIEGLQTAEACIVVAEALGEHASRLGTELAETCRAVLLERINYTRQHTPEPYGRIGLVTSHYGWQELDARLFATAAAVARKAPTRPPAR